MYPLLAGIDTSAPFAPFIPINSCNFRTHPMSPFVLSAVPEMYSTWEMLLHATQIRCDARGNFAHCRPMHMAISPLRLGMKLFEFA